jgi:alkylated DNA repair protein alkB family protein 1
MEFRNNDIVELKPNHGHNTHETPPNDLCALFREYHHMNKSQINNDLRVIDFNRGLTDKQKLKVHAIDKIDQSKVDLVTKTFDQTQRELGFEVPDTTKSPSECIIYEQDDFPGTGLIFSSLCMLTSSGLQIYTSLLPLSTQIALVSRLLHVDLSDPEHKTNINEDFEVIYPPSSHQNTTIKHDSMFSYAQNTPYFHPKHPKKNKPLQPAQFFRRLRWLTIGTQYNWATRKYPSPSQSTFPFPTCIRNLVRGIFPTVNAESGVSLLYTPKDFMPVHRDVSEESPMGIVSISLGCDGIFIISRNDLGSTTIDESNFAIIRVRSGDVLHIAGETRFRWHCMPVIITGTCPPELGVWPAVEKASGKFRHWKDWMASKRLNISLRQVFDDKNT